MTDPPTGTGAGSEAGVGVGVLGLGFMGRTHLRAYAHAARSGLANRVVAVCDRDAARLAGGHGGRGNLEAEDDAPLLDAHSALLEDPDELLARPDVELVSICTPTDTHVDLALRALEAGKHVLVEKPVALESDRVRLLAERAGRTGLVCMPAMCMRFWPGWDWLAEAVRSRRHGAARSLVLRRLGSRPGWSGFYADTQRSGGALFDLHVHDADLVRWLFGEPRSVSTTGSLEHLTTAYRFDAVDGGPAHVTAEGAWDGDPAFPFHMGFRATFEGATAEYVLGRSDPLWIATGGRHEAVPVAAGTGYEREVAHVLRAVRRPASPAAPTPGGPTLEDAVAVTRLLEAERRSLETGAPVSLA